MDLEDCINKSINLLRKGGKLIVVGLVSPQSTLEKFVEVSRVIPAKIGDLFHNLKGDIGVPIIDPKESIKDIRKCAKKNLPNSKIRQALYYRYLLTWEKTDIS